MFCCLLFNCKPLKIGEAKAHRVFTDGSINMHGFNYSIQLNIHKPLRIHTIALGYNCTLTTDFEIYQIPTGQLIDNKQTLKAGDYIINFFVGNSEELLSNNNKICLFYLLNEDLIKIEVNPNLLDDLVIS